MKLIKFVIIFASLFFVFTFSKNVHANPGDLDTTFGSNGITLTTFGFHDYAFDLAIQPDGKIVVAGRSTNALSSSTSDVSLARYNADGSLDTGFGMNGKTLVVETGNQFFSSLLLLPDGKIIVIGYEDINATFNYRLTVYRFNADGNLDTSFGTGGKVTHSIQNNCQTRDAALQPDGKIVIAGNVLGKFTVFRINTDGSLDTTFNSVGYNTILSSAGMIGAAAVAIQNDGKIVVGSSSPSFLTGYWGRFNSDGTLEGDDLIESISVEDVAIQSDGKIILVGIFGSGPRSTIIRFNADKTLDKKFGNFGDNTVFGSGRASSVIIESSGRIIVGGILLASSADSALARFNSNGFLDVGFGNNGISVTPISAGQNRIYNIAQQADGKIVAVGSAENTNDYDYFAARYDSGDSNTLPNRTVFDYDGDGRADVSVFRPSENIWYQLYSRNSSVDIKQFGGGGDLTAPADYNGDGRTDIAIFRPSTGQWWFSSVRVSGINVIGWGQSGDIPRPSDFDGDGKADLVLYRPSNGNWIRRGSAGQNSTIAFGATGDKPLIGDFDGDGKADPAIFRPSTGTWWYAASSASNEHRAAHWGISSDIPVPGDYDGDGKTDFAVYRPSDGVWYIFYNNTGAYTIVPFGLAEDKPVAADYDGDGKTDIAVFRPSTGVWYLMQTTAGFGALQWGISTDIPTENAFIP